MHTYFTQITGLTGGILTLLGFVAYIQSILRSGTKPKRSTWWIWTLNSLLLLTSYRAEGAQETIWLALGYAIGCVIVAFFTIKYGVGGWSKLDRLCLGGAIIAAILWIIIGPLATFIMSLVIDLFGVMPTMYASSVHPEEEDALSWVLWFIGGIISLLAVENIFIFERWSLAMIPIIAYPAQITITAGVIVWFIIRPRRKIY